MAEPQGVLVFAEVNEGKLAGVAREGLGVGALLAQGLGGGLLVGVLGKETDSLAKELIAFGAQTVYAVEHPELQSYQPDAFLQGLDQVIKAAQPKLVIFGHTDVGKDLAPKLAFRHRASLTMDCIDLSVEDSKSVVATKPVYGGNALCVFRTDAEMQMVTIRAKAFEPLERDDSRQGQITKVDGAIDPTKIKVRVLEVKKQEAAGVRLEDAAIVVSGGRGLGGPEPFDQLQELAKVLGAAVGASRAVVDAGWVPYMMQVGLTGKSIAPALYITVAISGASQHMAGCTGAKNIVAINKDKDANIFKDAGYGVVGDWAQVLPAFIEMCRELRG